MAKRTQNPKSRILYKKWIVGDKFDPYNPSDELIEELYEWVTPSSDYIKKNMRGIPFGKMDVDLASYLAYESRMGRPEIRLMASIAYFIKLAQDEEVSKQDLYDEITDLSECGIIATIHAKHLKDKWEI